MSVTEEEMNERKEKYNFHNEKRREGMVISILKEDFTLMTYELKLK